jgi:hypothetical protein
MLLLLLVLLLVLLLLLLQGRQCQSCCETVAVGVHQWLLPLLLPACKMLQEEMLKRPVHVDSCRCARETCSVNPQSA